MKKSKFTESQIIFALKQAETGTKVEEVCRKMGITEASKARLRFTIGKRSLVVWELVS